MMLSVPDEFASSVKSLLLYSGPPREDEIQGIEELKKGGGKVIFFMTEEEKKTYALKHDEAGVTWDTDASLKKWLFENLTLWQGGQIGGNTPEKATQLAGLLGEVINLTNFDNQSLKFLTKDNEPARNMYKNYRWIEEGVPLARAKGKGAGTTALIIAAGPSLDDQWGELARIRRDVPGTTIICCGRSYAKAMEMGVVPDFVVEVEQFDWDDKIFLFAPKPHPGMVLCGPITACPGLFNSWPGIKMVLLDHDMAKFLKMEIGTDSIDGGNSIIHHMFNVAVFLGCEEVALAGIDLSYPPGCKDTHATGTFHAWPRTIVMMEHNRQEPLMAKSTDGGMVQASQPYKNFRLFLEMQIAANRKKMPNLKVYNFSPHGQFIEGTEFRDIATWGLPSSPPPSSSAAPSSPELGSSAPGSPSTSSLSGPTDSASS